MVLVSNNNLYQSPLFLPNLRLDVLGTCWLMIPDPILFWNSFILLTAWTETWRRVWGDGKNLFRGPTSF